MQKKQYATTRDIMQPISSKLAAAFLKEYAWLPNSQKQLTKAFKF